MTDVKFSVMDDVTKEAEAPLGWERAACLAAIFVSGDLRAKVTDVCSCEDGRIVFYGRADGREHSLCLGKATRSRIREHWEAFVLLSQRDHS